MSGRGRGCFFAPARFMPASPRACTRAGCQVRVRPPGRALQDEADAVRAGDPRVLLPVGDRQLALCLRKGPSVPRHRAVSLAVAVASPPAPAEPD